MNIETPQVNKVREFIKKLPEFEYRVSTIKKLLKEKENCSVGDKTIRNAFNLECNWVQVGIGSKTKWRNINKIDDKTTIQDRIKKMKGKYSIRSPYKKRRRLPFNILGFNPVEPDFPVQTYTVGFDKKENKHDIYDDYALETIENMFNEGILQKVKN